MGVKLPWLTAAFLAAWALWFTLPGLSQYFLSDDLMNLYFGWHPPLADLLKQNLLFFLGPLRPFGTLVYRFLYEAFGLDPLPFRVACFVLILLNSGLSYAVARLVMPSRGAAALATLIAIYHAPMADIYYATSILYDLLAFFFYFAAFLAWARWRNLIACLLLFVLALNSKEIAVSLPLVLAAYEMWNGRQWRGVIGTGVIALLYTGGKIYGPLSMVNNPAYHMEMAPAVWLQRWTEYTRQLLFTKWDVNSAMAVGIVLAVIGIAVISRRRDLRWAATMIAAGTVPVLPIEQRSPYVLYLAWLGWAVFFAGTLHWITRGRRPVAVFLLVAAFWFPLQRWGTPRSLGAVNEAQKLARQPVEQLRTKFPNLEKGSRVLFLDDPYPADDWLLTFAFRLLYHHDDWNIDRAKRMDHVPTAEELAAYKYVFRFEDWNLRLESHR